MTNPKELAERILRAIGWMARNPIPLLKFASAMEREHGQAVELLLDGDTALWAGGLLMVRGGVEEAVFTRSGITWRTDITDIVGQSLWRYGGTRWTRSDPVLKLAQVSESLRGCSRRCRRQCRNHVHPAGPGRLPGFGPSSRPLSIRLADS